MEFIHESSRIFLEGDTGELLAEITFPRLNETTYIINHTYVAPALRGQKVAEQLVRLVVEQARKQQMTIVPQCDYAQKEFMRKQQYEDVWEKG